MSQKPSYQELEQKILELEGRLTAHKQNKNPLSQTLADDQTMIADDVDGFWLTDLHGRLLEVNHAYCRMSGYTEDQLRTMHIPQLEGNMKPDEVFKKISKVQSCGSLRFETRHRRKDGSLFDVAVTVQYLQQVSGLLVVFLRDITESKKSQKRLHQLSKMWELAQNVANIGYWNYNLKTGDSVWSEQTFRSTGFDPAKGVPDYPTFLNRLHPDDREPFNNAFKRAKNGTSCNIEVRAVLKKEGTNRWFNFQGYPRRDEEGCLYELFGIIQDITAYKAAESSLRFTQYAIDNSNVQAIWMTKGGRLVYVNDSACKALGYSRQELMNMSIPDLDPDFPPEVFEQHWRRLKKQRYLIHETRHRAKDGHIYPVEVRDNFVVMDGKEYNCAFWMDISERKKMDQSLRESESFRRGLLRAIPDLVWLKDPKGIYLACNIRFEKFFGANEADIIGKTDYHFMDKEQADFFRNHDLKAMRKNGPYINEERLTFQGNGYTGIFETIKIPMRESNGELLGVLGISRDITLRKQTEISLRETQEKLKEAQSLACLGFWTWDIATGDVEWSEEVYRIFRLDPETFTPTIDAILALSPWPEDHQRGRALIQKATESRDPGNYEQRFLFPDGTTGYYSSTFQGVYDHSGKLTAMKGTIQDITEKKRAEAEQMKMEAQLRQAQKMESIGRLAGGVAHDFNNVLSVIFGNAEMACEETAPDQPIHGYLMEIIKAAERSTDITRQLLAFARKQPIAPRNLDLNSTVTTMLKMIQRLIGEEISLNWLPGENLCPVRMDPAQLDQILINLCINAKDAIRERGRITIETKTKRFDEADCKSLPGSVPGEFVLLSVSDDGCGMDKNTLQNIFEPFFTTKGEDKGTGLGLATVYGIVKQNEGFINVYSEPNNGTTFRVYLRSHVSSGSPMSDRDSASSDAHVERTGTILLVEDEPSILKIVRMILEKSGYCVLTAPLPKEAIRIAREYEGRIDLLVTDVVMPEMNGIELERRLRTLYPELKHLFMSGYTSNVIAHHGILNEGIHFISKPFSQKELSAKIRESLGRSDAKGSA